MDEKQPKLHWNTPKLTIITAQGGKTQTNGSESVGCPEVAGEHFFGPRHRLTNHRCNSSIAGGSPSQVNNTVNTQIGGANTTTTSPGPS